MKTETLIEKEIKKFNQIKMDLLKISKCIEYCTEINQKEMYQNIAMEYSKELKHLSKYIQNEYQVTFCAGCKNLNSDT